MRKVCLLVFFVHLTFILLSGNGDLIFKQNKHQWPEHVKYGADYAACQFFIEEKGLTWQLFDANDISKAHHHRMDGSKERSITEPVIKGHVYKVEFVGGSFDKNIAESQVPEYFNYFLDNDPAHWASKVNGFMKLTFTSVYQGIDIRFYGKHQLKYDVIVKPFADIKQIQLKYDHTNGVEVINGKLVIRTSVGDVVESIPEAYQIRSGKKVKVNCEYRLLNEKCIRFQINGSYDPSVELVIDPVVVASSYSGSESVSFGLGVVPDNMGNMYLSSMNVTKHYPTTVGAIQLTYGGGFHDNTLSKFNATGTAKFFSTYIGGNKEELIINCAIQSDEIAIFGSTNSDTFPVVKNGYQQLLNGKTDYFVIKLDTSGSILKGSTFLGGSRAEAFSTVGKSTWYYPAQNSFGELIMDKWNNCYVIGSTLSHDYPTTPGSYREYSDSNGFSDIVITKITADLRSLFWSTYYGGSSNNSPTGLRISRSGKLYCAGTTNSKNFPTTPGAVHSTSVSTLDMVAFSLDTLQGFPQLSSYIGARSTEAIRFDLDLNDNLYIIGNSVNPNLTTPTPGAYNINTGSVFFYKLDPLISQIPVIARFGYPTLGDYKMDLDAMNIDSCGYIYFGGFAHPGLPVTPDAFKSVSSAKGNMYLGVFNPNLSSLKFGSYYGSDALHFEDHDDGGLNYFDDRGYFYHAVCVADDWPVTPGAYSAFNIKDSMSTGGNNYLQNSDGFVKIDLQTFVNANSSLGGVLKSCSPITATFATNANLGSVTIIPGDGSPAVNTPSLVHSYNSFGTYTAFVIAGADSSTCNIIDSIRIFIKYGPRPVPSLEEKSINCNGSTLVLDAGNTGASYYWNTGETTQTIKPSATGSYWVKVENDYCSITDSTYASVEQGQSYTAPNAFTPNGDGENDRFCLKGWKHCNETFSVFIFNRWGEKVFESEDPDFCWDGTLRGKPLSSDVYVYHIMATYQGATVIDKKGNITLLR